MKEEEHEVFVIVISDAFTNEEAMMIASKDAFLTGDAVVCPRWDGLPAIRAVGPARLRDHGQCEGLTSGVCGHDAVQVVCYHPH
jgi:hypothetical protein